MSELTPVEKQAASMKQEARGGNPVSMSRSIKRLKTISVFTFLICLSFCYAYAGQYFSCENMDHFSPEGFCKETPKQNPRNQQTQSDTVEGGFTREQIEMWAEPTVDSNGKVVSKLPPLPALKVLVDPTPENAKAYLEWNHKRMEAIQKSQALIQQYSGISQPQGITDLKQIKKVDFYFSPT